MMIVKIILEEELNTEELKKLEILFKETERTILDTFLIVTDSPELARICRKLDMAVAAVLTEKEKNFSEIPYAVTDIDNLDEFYLRRVWQRYRGIPWEICETERCLVRETTIEDVDAFYRIYQDESITAFMENLYPNREDEIRYTRDYIKEVYGFYGFGMWSVCYRETGEVIGRAGLSMRAGFETPELGYVIAAEYQKKGIATEVCRAILNYGKQNLNLDWIRAIMHPQNQASARLCQKLGFHYGGKLTLDGIVYDAYAILLK